MEWNFILTEITKPNDSSKGNIILVIKQTLKYNVLQPWLQAYTSSRHLI